MNELEFIKELEKKSPKISKILNEHIQDNDEILPYVFMDELSRLLIEDQKHSNDESLFDIILPYVNHVMESENEKNFEGIISTLIRTSLCSSIDELYYIDRPLFHLIFRKLEKPILSFILTQV